jgi:hypothetical protein
MNEYKIQLENREDLTFLREELENFCKDHELGTSSTHRHKVIQLIFAVFFNQLFLAISR